MKIGTSKRKKLAVSLRKRNSILTWRQIAEQDYGNSIHYSVLCKIAKTNGAYIPSDVASQMILGLIVPRSPYAVMPRWWNRTPDALKRFLHIKAKVKGMYDKTKQEQFAYRKVKQ